MEPRTCKYCEKTFTDMSGKVFANHVRWCDKNKTNGDKGRSNISKGINKGHDKRIGQIKSFTKICANSDCNSIFVVNCRSHNLNNTSNYCSIECRNIVSAHVDRIWTDEMKSEVSIRSKELWTQDEYIEKQMKNNMGANGKRRFTSKGEEEMREYFKTKFPDDGWTHGGSLKMGEHRLVRDLFSKQLKVCIEYDGIWHFKDIKCQLERKQIKDLALEEWCKENGWRLIRIDEDVYNADKKSTLELLESHVYNTNISVIKIGERY